MKVLTGGRYQALAPSMDERMRRLFPGAEALVVGREGQAAVARATGAAPGTIRQGIRELRQVNAGTEKGRIRRAGSGRWSRTPPSARTWSGWWNPRHAGTRSPSYGGLLKACGSCPRNCRGRGILPAIVWSPSCRMRWATACKRRVST